MRRFSDVLSESFSRRGWTVEQWRPEARFVRWVKNYRYGGLPKYLGYLDKFVVFPRDIRALRKRAPGGAVFHITDHSNAVYARHFRGAPLLVTCHDLLPIRCALGEFPQCRLSRSGQRYQNWILSSLKSLKTAICVSEKTKLDLQRLAGLGPSATPVIYMGLNYPYRPMPREEALALLSSLLARQRIAPGLISPADEPFLVGIGGAQWYKNRTGLISIFCELQKRPACPRKLVYVGPALDAEQLEVLARHECGSQVIHLRSVSNEELRAIYSLASALIFPSWEEGFGWPIAEAQACGCPVFTSDRAPMTEVGGSAARYLDPSDADGAADLIAAELSHAPTMRSEGLAAASRWSTDRMIDEYEQQYWTAARERATVAAAQA
ncbi:glycosyltransferase family 1 protein [Opitutaceae bacterium EW11]|nr:glycosyltransferase family 1 protein [Opitutaceae bacterium EW11]